MAQGPTSQLVDKHPEINETLHRGEWVGGNTMLPASGIAGATTYETNQENLTRGGLQVGKPVVGLSTTPVQGTTTTGMPLPNTGLSHGLQLPGQQSLPIDSGMKTGDLRGSTLSCGHMSGTCPRDCVSYTSTTMGTSSSLGSGLGTSSMLGSGLGTSNLGSGLGTSNLGSGLGTSSTLGSLGTTSVGGSALACGHMSGSCPSDCVSYTKTTTTSIPLESGGLSGSLADPKLSGSTWDKSRVPLDSVKYATQERMLHETPDERRL